MSAPNTEHVPTPYPWHRRLLESRGALFAGLTTLAILVGGIVELTPMFAAPKGPQVMTNVTPYTPLEVAGRDIYIREGCYTCHSQMVRPFRAETLRYGEWSRADEYAWDRPFQLGSRRAGPDLHRVGGKYPDAWHFEHMRDPRTTSPGSIMPSYSWLADAVLDAADVKASVVALQRLGTPYTDAEVEGVAQSIRLQGSEIVQNLLAAGIQTSPDREIVALIAYLQRLGRDGRAWLEQHEDGAAAVDP